MQNNQQQEWGMREKINLMWALATAWSTAITPFTRRYFGKNALGWPGAFALGLIALVAGFGGSEAMLVYLPAWVLAVGCQRIDTWKRARKGIVPHSHYPGEPIVGLRLTGNLRAALLVAEPLVVAAFGAMFYYGDERVLGGFLLGGAGALVFRELLDRQISDNRMTAMRDAELEQRWLIEQYRNHRP